jgi:hypothetical protein
MKPIKLDWSPIMSFREIDKLDKCGGVYIWGFALAEFKPYYIGSAIDIKGRLLEHVCCIHSGKYTIYKSEDLKNWDKDTKPIYRPNWPDSIIEFVQRQQDLKEHILFMVERFAFSFSPLFGNDMLQVKNVESACLNKFGIEKLANTRMPAAIFADVIHKGHEEIVLKFA